MARHTQGDEFHDGKLGVNINPASMGASGLGGQAGTSSNDWAAGGVLYVTTTQTGNVGIGEDVLASYVVPASTLAVNGQSLWFEASGSFANSANTVTLRVRFGTSGTNLVVSRIDTATGKTWELRGRIFRTGAATQKGHGRITLDGSVASTANVATGLNQTLSGSVTFEITGEGTSNNDLVLETLVVGWDDANT